MIKKIIAPVIEEVGKFGEAAKKQVSPDGNAQNSQAQTSELVKDIYKPQEEHAPEELLKKQAEDKKKEAQLVHSLHQQYVQATFNRPKAKEEPVAKKLEDEKKKERWELAQEEKKKPPPLPVQRAQNIEKHRGASG